jgi:DNA-binding transcriptional regulator YdaS (Cro superfamily)
MKLNDYITQHNLKPRDLARLIGCGKSMAYYLLSGQRRPSPNMASRIERATGGAVTRLELLYPD